MLNRLFRRAQTFQRIKRAFDQTRREKVVPTTRHQREAKAFGVQLTLMCDGLQVFPATPSFLEN
jgi:hypothetical protein